MKKKIGQTFSIRGWVFKVRLILQTIAVKIVQLVDSLSGDLSHQLSGYVSSVECENLGD